MKNILNERLRQKMDETGLSVHALEKKAGLKRSAVQNILHGRSKKPSAEILFAISKVFGCSMRELLDKNSPPVHYHDSIPQLIHPPAPATAQRNEIPIDIELYVKAVKTAEKIFKKFPTSYNETAALNYILEIYQYTAKNNHEKIDSCFAQWLFNKSFRNIDDKH